MQNGMELSSLTQAFAYETKGNSAVIWRCFSRDTKALIPASVDGYTVTEVAPYAFSAHMDERGFEKEILLGKMKFYIPSIFSVSKDQIGSYQDVKTLLPPALCGDSLEKIVFPYSVVRIGRYCFYNCSGLKSLEFWSTLADWGSGVFTGSHSVRDMCIHMVPDRPSALKQVLDEIYEELYVTYVMEKGFDEEAESDFVPDTADLVFPEFFVEGIENTPARILEERIHGTGMMYRNCFKGKVFDFRQYDTWFDMAVVHEPEKIVGKLAKGRLCTPYELTEKAKEQYLDYVKSHAASMSDWMLEERDLEALHWLLSIAERTESLNDHMIKKASMLQYTEALSFLMEYQHAGRTKTTRRRMEL